jgi:acyl-CoA reductase-like NAD-dependent aldehyde dehydrogenase
MKIPVALKPGRDEPWTPMRIMQALIAAGYPRQEFGFYPTDHEGADAILGGCGRAILFGDDATTRRYTDQPTVQCHGTGRSKIILGPDAASRWRDYLDVMVESILENGGRSCINASCIITAAHGDEIADALAQRLATVRPRPADDESAALATFVNPSVAEAIDARIDRGLQTDGARDVTAEYRTGPRCMTVDGLAYLLPTIVRCPSLEHPLGNTEFLFPFAAVVEMPIDDAVDRIGPTLTATLITRDQTLRAALLACAHVDRLNLGAVATTRVEWDQPHEGNLFEFLYRRRAIQREAV